MNREQAKELLPIIQAFAEGKQVEIKSKESNSWETLEEDDMQYVDFKKCDLRIKPEPKYRPFKDSEECYNEMLKHQPFGWLKSNRLLYNIISIDANRIIINNSIRNGGYSFKTASRLTFADGTPFGIKEDK